MRAYRNSQRQEEAVIWLSNSKNSFLKPFKNFEELSDYFKRVEYLTDACFDHSLLAGKWDFVYEVVFKFEFSLIFWYNCVDLGA
jgi:hypothetical protein